MSGYAPDNLEPSDTWRTQGTCASPEYAGIHDALWFAEDSDRDAVTMAVGLCSSCPVQAACLASAKEEEAGKGRFNRWGIRGGLTARQRWNADHNIGDGAPREPSPIITYGSHQQAYDACVLADGDHLVWVGGNEIRVAGTRYSPNQTAWWVARGTAPVGRVFTDCDRSSCVQHLTDQNMRDARKADAAEQPTPKSAKCGTRPGYQRHLREKTVICTPCRQANADADRRLRNTGTTKVKASV